MFSRYKPWVEHGLARSVPNAGGSGLYIMVQYHLGWVDETGNRAVSPSFQGKALRPTLCLFACDALCGDAGRASTAATALELIHNFSLIHDDIQDQDEERRHQPTVWSLWGVPRALAAGNALQCVGDLALLEAVGPASLGTGRPELALKVSQLLTASYLEMIRGQCMDLVFEGRSRITAAEYLDMIAGKTGALIRLRFGNRGPAGNGRSGLDGGVFPVRQRLGTRLPSEGRPPGRMGRPGRHRQGGRQRHTPPEEVLPHSLRHGTGPRAGPG